VPRAKVERPQQVTTEGDRRQLLKWLIQENGGVGEVSRNSGVSRNHLARLTRGHAQVRGKNGEQELQEYRLLDMTIETITGLLNAFSLSDPEAWTMFNIAPELRDRWRSARKEERPTTITKIWVEQILGGDCQLYLEGGFYVLVDEAEKAQGLLIVEMYGRPYAFYAETLPEKVHVRGRFAGITLKSQA